MKGASLGAERGIQLFVGIFYNVLQVPLPCNTSFEMQIRLFRLNVLLYVTPSFNFICMDLLVPQQYWATGKSKKVTHTFFSKSNPQLCVGLRIKDRCIHCIMMRLPHRPHQCVHELVAHLINASMN
jgi:hypothetical protein